MTTTRMLCCHRRLGGRLRHTRRQPATANDQTDVWFMQHMVPHLLQNTSITTSPTTDSPIPRWPRLAGHIHRRCQEHVAELQRGLAARGLAPHGHSHQRGDTLRRGDLERLSRLHGAALDLAYVKVMTARHRAGNKLAATEARDGSLPEVRQLARQLLADQQAQVSKMQAWRRAWFTAQASHPPATAPRHP